MLTIRPLAAALNKHRHRLPASPCRADGAKGAARHLSVTPYPARKEPVPVARLRPSNYPAKRCRVVSGRVRLVITIADLVNFVGERFLREIIDDHFTDRPIISPNIRREVKIKHGFGAARAILNAPASTMYPEQCDHLVRRYGPDDDVISAKRKNLVEFQKRTGLNIDPSQILLYWPSRLDPSQKGIELLEAIAHKFVIAHEGTQIAIVGNGVGNERSHEEICGRIACASGGKITYQRFSEPLSMLGFAAASNVFGASLYEPCGQIDQVGNLFGATVTNRDTGGYHDKIQDLVLRDDGEPKDSGNGFLFRDYDPGGLWYGLSRTVQFHRRSPEIRERQTKRIMREARQKYDPKKMIDRYIDAYEELSGGIPLRTIGTELVENKTSRPHTAPDCIQ